MNRKQRHKCADCGFLTLRNRFTNQLDEVPHSYRTAGVRPNIKREVPLPQRNSPSDMWLHPYTGPGSLPLCFQQSAAFFVSPNKAPETDLYDMVAMDLTTVLAEITKPRVCNEFTPWRFGATPKDHREMRDRRGERRFRIIEIMWIVGGNLVAIWFGAQITASATREAAQPPRIEISAQPVPVINNNINLPTSSPVQALVP